MKDLATPRPTGPVHESGALIDGLTVESMSHGAAAIARDRSKVVFVAGGAPGDLADVEIVQSTPRFSRAIVRELRAAGDARRQPECPHAGRCGGCQWQHLAYQAQLDAKQKNLVDHLVRVGGLRAPPVHRVLSSPAEWRYRHRLTLRVDGARLGFYRAESHELVEISECRIAAAPLENGLAAARGWLGQLATTIRRLSLAVSEDGEDIVLSANAEGPFVDDDDGVNRQTVARVVAGEAGCRIRGIVMFGRGWRRMWGDAAVTVSADGASLTSTGGEFTQVNLAGNRLLIEVVVSLAAVTQGDDVLDLYCGAGNLTFPLARRGARVTSVERSPRQVADAEANARRLGLSGCRFVCAHVGTAVAQLVQSASYPRVVIMDPPRGGAAEILDDLVRIRPERVVYVSCDPPTLARDVARLVRDGFRLEAVRPIDLFPQTYHLEAVALLTRG